MSLITHPFINEFRPFFRLLEEPRGTSFDQNHPVFRAASGRPAVDLSEEGNTYIVEADLPGVRKEDLDIRIGDNGQSVTIEGRVVSRRGGRTPSASTSVEGGKGGQQGGQAAGGAQGGKDVARSESNQLSTERSSSSASFLRTVWLPRPVDPKRVEAHLEHGVLTLTMEKADDTASVKINVA